MTVRGRPPRPGTWERICGLLFRLYPPRYRRRHGAERRRLLAELLDEATHARERSSRARRFAFDAARTLPGAWWQAVRDASRTRSAAGGRPSA
ncbi:MAG: hypothetical protein ACODAE_06725, partial [Gemmatimonadota bacterium]